MTGRGRLQPALRGLLASAVIALTLALAAPPSAAESPPALSLAEVRSQALAAFDAGDLQKAAVLARALLARDPRDGFAHLILAALQRAEGRPDLALGHARKSFRYSAPGEQRLQAAYLAAQLAFEARRDLASLYWLRRAYDQTREPARRLALSQDYARLKDKAETGLFASFTLAPSTNVNAGSRMGVNIIDGLPVIGLLSPDAQALSGVVAEAGLSVSRVLSRGQDRRTELALSLSGRHVMLDGAALARLGPSPRPALDSGRAEISLRHEVTTGRLQSHQGSLGLGLALREGALPQAYLRLGLSAQRRLSDRLDLSFGGQFEAQAPYPSGARGDQLLSLQLGAAHMLEGGAQLSAGLVLAGQSTVIAGRSNTSVGLRLGFEPARPVGPLRLRLDLGVQASHFPGYTIGWFEVPGGRRDVTGFAELSLSVDNLSFAGFSPELRLRHSVTSSNVSRFDSVETGLAFGLASSF